MLFQRCEERQNGAYLDDHVKFPKTMLHVNMIFTNGRQHHYQGQ